MMEATDLGDFHDIARLGGLHGPTVRRVLVQREVRPSLVIVVKVAGKDAAQVPFPEDEHVIQTLASDRADEPLREGILPGATGGSDNFTDSHVWNAPLLSQVPRSCLNSH